MIDCQVCPHFSREEFSPLQIRRHTFRLRAQDEDSPPSFFVTRQMKTRGFRIQMRDKATITMSLEIFKCNRMQSELVLSYFFLLVQVIHRSKCSLNLLLTLPRRTLVATIESHTCPKRMWRATLASFLSRMLPDSFKIWVYSYSVFSCIYSLHAQRLYQCNFDSTAFGDNCLVGLGAYAMLTSDKVMVTGSPPSPPTAPLSDVTAARKSP